MRCDFDDSLLHGYFDCELGTASADEFERHLEDCAACASELVELDILSARLRVASLYEVAPALLKKRIHTRLRPVTPTTAMPRQLFWHWLAVATSLFVLLVAGWRLGLAFRTDDYRAELAEEIVDGHVRALQLGA